MTMQGGTARDRLRARAQAMYGGKRREDEEYQQQTAQRQEAETPAVGSARDRLRQRASAMGVVTGQGANTQEPTQERSRLTVEGYEAAIKGMQERMGGQTGLTKSGIVQHTQSRETERWRQEQAKKYSGLREQADYAKKSTKVDQSLASGKGAYIFGHYVGKGDDVYSYINSIGTAYENRSNAGQTPSGKLAKYAYMTDDEVADYNYLYQTKGKEEAEKYLEYMGTELDARRAAGFSQWNSELAEKAPVLASAASVPMNLTSGVGLVGVGLQNIRNQVTGEYKPINYYSPAMDATVASTAIRGTRAQHLADKYGTIQMDEKAHPLLSRIFNGKSWGDVYQLGMSMVDSAAAAGIGKGTGLTAAGTALLGGSAGSQGVLDAVERGATDSQALTMGILNATFESLFEYVSLDHLLKGNTKNILKGFLKQGFIEGSEEWNTTLFNTIADVLVMAENSDYKTSVRDYMEQGYSEKEAERQAMFDIAVGMGWDFVGGAISGGLMDTGKQIVRDATYKSKFGKASGDIVAEAQEVAPGTALTQKAQERIDAGKSLTGHQIVNLLQQNEDAIRTGDMVTIRNAVAERLAQYGESQNIDRVADAITKQVAGEKLSGKEKALVENSAYGQRVLNEMNPENISEGGFNSAWAGQLGTTQINAEAYSQKLREAQAETQQEEPQQTERKEMTPEEMAVLSAWNSEVESSPANSTTVQPNLGDRETLEALGVKTGSQLRAEVRQALTERQAVAQQRTQVAQQTQETQEAAQRTPVTLEKASKAYGKQAKAFLRTYQQGQDVEKFSEAYRIAHEMGESNVPYRVVQGMRSLDYLTEAQKDIAYRTGASAEKQEGGGKKATWRRQGVVRAENGAKLSDLSKTFNVPQKQGYRILSDIAKSTGVDIVLYRSKGDAEGNITEAEGRFRRSENTIFIDVNSGIDNVNSTADFSQYTMLRTFNHEFTHFIEQNADEEYRELRKLVFEVMQEKLDGQEGGVTVDDLIREKQDKYRQALGQEISYDEASREVVADAMTDILPDSHFMETLYNRNATLAEKLIGKLKDFIAKVKAYFDGLTTNTKAEAALLKEMRDGGLHYLESIVEAYDKAATAAVENYQGAETRSEGGEDQYMARGKYWRPQLKQEEWDLLEWRMNAEIKSGENFLDEATKWVYADEKGVQVFALYGIGDGTDATPLYAVGGKKAAAYNAAMTEFMERSQKYDGDGRSVDPLSELPWRKEGSRSGNLSQTSRKTGDAEGVSELHGGSQRSDSGRASGRGTENQRGVKDQFSIREIKGEDGTDYGKGVYLDSTLLEGLTDAERKEMMRERVKELGGQTITAYDPNGEAVDIRIAAPSEKFRNRNGRRVPVTNDLARKNRDVKVKQESVVLADELIATSQYKRPRKAKYPHGWLDNNGKNDWQYWTTYIQDKNNTVWEATLNVAESANGVKYLYDIDPIEKVGQPVKSGTSTTLVGQPVKSGTSTTGNIVAQDQTESQAQIRSSTLSDRDVLRIAAQMAKNSESRSLTDADRARLGILEQKLGRIDEAEEQRQGFLEEKRAILAGREAKELSDAERAQLRKVQKNLDTVNGKIRRLNEELSQTQEKKVVKALLKKARVVVERDAVQRGVARLNEYKNRRSAAELRTSIKKTAKAFQQMLLHPTGTKYAPESLIQSCIDVATMLDTSGEREDTKAKAQYRSMMDALNTLKTQYDDLKNNPDSDFRGEYDTNFAYMVEQLAKRLGGKPVRDLTLTELQDVHSVLRDIQTMLRNAKYQIGQAERITNYAVGESIIRDMEKIPERTVAERAMDTTSRLTISPLRNIRRLTMYNDNSQLVRLFNALNDGIKKKNRFMMECDKLFERFLGKRFRKAAGLVKSYNVGTRTFKMTEMEAIQLVLTWEREAHGETSHLAKGGFIIPNHYLLKKGKFEDAFLKGTTYSHVQQSEIDAIQRTFDKWALDYKAAVKNEFFNGIAKNAINNTTLQLKGRAVALTPDYVSIEVDKNSVVTELEGVKFDATIEGMGMLKSVVKGASNPVIIRGVHSLVESHIERVGQLYGLAIPIRNFNKAYNVKTVDGTSSVRGAIGKTWSAADLKMIEQAISDLQTPRKRADVFDKMVRKATSSFVKAKLLSNISVTIKQAASYSTAGLYLSQKALFPYQTTVVGLFVSNKSKFAKKLFAEIDEHTAEHYIRRKGMSMQEINTIAKDNSKIVRDMDENLPDAANPLKWIQNMDVATTAALWLATKKQVALDGMKTTDPGYWDAVTILYEKVIEETQPMYDTLHRPEVQRTPDEIVRGVLMFRTQPLQNTGILYDAFGELNQAVKSKDAEWVKRARKKAAMAVGSQLASLAVFSVMTMLAGAAKNRLYRYLNDEDELTIQSIMLRVLGDMATNGAGLLIPIGGSELAELVEKQLTGSSYGGEFSVSVVDMLNDYIDQFGKCWKDVADLNDGGREKLPTDLRDLSMDTAGLFGIPAENVFNIIRGVVGNISDTFSEEPIQWATDIPDPNVSAIKAAFDNGHMDTAKDKIVELIAFKVKSGKTEKEAASSVRSSITSYYKPLYLKALRSGDKEEMRRIASIIKASGLYSEGADATLEKWASAAD